MRFTKEPTYDNVIIYIQTHLKLVIPIPSDSNVLYEHALSVLFLFLFFILFLFLFLFFVFLSTNSTAPCIRPENRVHSRKSAIHKIMHC